MLIAGAKGFAKEVLEIYNQLDQLNDLAFFDDISEDIGDSLFDSFKVLKSIEDVKLLFRTKDPSFTLGVGDPNLRALISQKLIQAGGILTSTISPKASIGRFGNVIEEGCSIMTGVIITNDISIGKGCLINLNCTIGHDSILDEFVELSPNVNISGRCKIGSYTSIGTNATVIPDVKIGRNCIVAAGSVVLSDVPNNSLVAGVPAIIKKQL